MRAFNVIRIILFMTVIVAVGVNEYYESVNTEIKEEHNLPIIFTEKIQNTGFLNDTTSTLE